MQLVRRVAPGQEVVDDDAVGPRGGARLVLLLDLLASRRRREVLQCVRMSVARVMRRTHAVS